MRLFLKKPGFSSLAPLRRVIRSLPVGLLILAFATVSCTTGCKKEKKAGKKPKTQPISQTTPTPTPSPTPAPTPQPPPGAVYFLSNPDGLNTVEAFSRNSTTGFVTYLGSFPSGGNGTTAIQGSQSHAVVANGSFLYAVNSGNGSFSTFRLDADGRPTLFATTSSNGTRPVSIAIHGNLLFVLNQGIPAGDGGSVDGGLVGFSIGADGIPAAIPGAITPFDSEDMPSDVFFTGNGLRLAVMRSGAKSVSTFAVDPSGALSDQQSINVGSQPVGGAATSRLPWAGFAAIVSVVEDYGPASVVSFQAESALTIVSQVGADVDTDPCWATTSVNGQRLWTSNFQPKTLTLYRVGSDSSLVREGLYEPAPGIGPGSLDLDVSADGRFLYRLRAFNSNGSPTPPHPFPIVEVFQINPSNANGGLSLIQSVEVPTLALQYASPTGMAVADLQ
jgi:6-phosphogluconolactonase (cycloisomerase 2 family)